MPHRPVGDELFDVHADELLQKLVRKLFAVEQHRNDGDGIDLDDFAGKDLRDGLLVHLRDVVIGDDDDLVRIVGLGAEDQEQ